MTPPTVYHLRNESGIEVFTGTISPAPGGGSQPGALLTADFEFDEPSVAGPDIVKTFAVPVDATVLGVFFYPLVAGWGGGGNDLFTMGDTANPAGYADPQFSNVLSLADPYDPTSVSNTNFATNPQASGTYGFASPFALAGNDPGGGVLYPAGDTLTMTASNLTDAGGGGKLLVRIIYLAAITAQ